jgi:hypothetical protein
VLVMPEFGALDIWVKGGLLDPKHRKAMGEALWLYLYIQQLVRFDGADAGSTPREYPYQHTEAATALGVTSRTVMREFQRLEAYGYITSRRTRYGLHVSVTKYLPQSTRAKRRTPRSDATVTSNAAPEVTSVAPRSDTHDRENGHPRHQEVTSVSPVYKEDKRPSESSDQAAPARARVNGAPKPNKSADLIDALRAADVPVEMTPRDHQALQKSSLTVAQVAEAYCAVYRGEWGDDWLQDNLAVHVVINRWAGYLASKTQPPPKRRGGPESSMTRMLRARDQARGEARSTHALPGS